MGKRKKRARSWGWQAKRLLEFAQYERDEAQFYEGYYEKTTQKVPMRILSVMVFFLKEEYRSKPGSLITVYRVNREQEGFCPFDVRFEKYYQALQERGYR